MFALIRSRQGRRALRRNCGRVSGVYDKEMATKVSALGISVFACTPDQFPGLMAAALRREDVQSWAASENIKTFRENNVAAAL